MNENGKPTDERDDVATLLGRAGKRPAVPPDRAERVRMAAEGRWREELSPSRSRRPLGLAVLLAAAAVLVLAFVIRGRIGGPDDSEGVIVVESLTGTARVGGTELTVGARLETGAELETSENGRVAIRLASGHSVRLDTSSSIRLAGDVRLALDRGAIYIDSGLDARTGQPIAVETPFGVVQEIGTQFEVRLGDGSMRVRLREGAVALQREDQTHSVRAGTELEIGSDSTPETRPIAIHGGAWDWIFQVVPMPDIEGRSASTFLRWIARERGWTLEYSDENVARSAERIVLDGSLDRLTPQQALDAVLPTCRMVYSLEDGVLRIAADEIR